jgi:hypothetical protein
MQPSTTALGMARLQAGHIDLYEPGTKPERQYKGLMSVFDHDAEVQPLPTAHGGGAGDQEYDYDGELDEEFEFDCDYSGRDTTIL